MFNSVTGRLSEKRADSICVETGGVEWELAVPARSVDDFGAIGEEVRAFTWLHHYEDGMRLYGFPTEEDRSAFKELLKVEGIGPKQALRVLSGIAPGALGAALEAEDLGALQAIPGVGPKLAQKMLLALKGKLAPGGSAGKGSGRRGDFADVARALVDMGYDRKAAEKAVAEAAANAVRAGATAGAPVGEREREVFREALLALSAGA